MKTAKELSTHIGLNGILRSGAIGVPVIIEDARVSSGETQYLVAPIGGEGQVWVSDERVRVTKEGKV